MVKRAVKQKSLLVVESPGKTAKLSSILGDQFLVRASFGHILELSKTRIYNLGVDVTPGADYKIYKIISPSKKDKLAALIDAASNCSEILIATDADREGESIGADVAEMLLSAGLPTYRVKFTEITKAAVLKAVQNKEEIDFNLVNAASCRQALDQIVGFLSSPFILRSFKNDPDMKEARSAGRVQSVAVRLVIDREEEIVNFKPEEYWSIFANLAKKSELTKKINAKYTEKVNIKIDAQRIKSELENDTFSVTKVDAKEKKRPPFPPFITSTLQIHCANKYGMAVDDVMKCAQTLYESGKITYLRTDSTHVSPEAIEDVRSWLKDNNHNIPAKPNHYASKSQADAHEAIRVTSVQDHPDTIYLPDDQKKVYRAIWERFVCSQMDSAIYNTLAITIKSSSDHELKASGRTLKYSGWLDLMPDQVSVKSDDEDDITLPNLSVGDNLILIAPKVVATQKWTTSPPRFSEGSFIKELEKRGIGRPSTFSNITNKIKDRGYVALKNKIYHGTEVGKKVTEKLIKYFKFLDYTYTAEMEEKLDLVAEGKLSYVDMMDGFFIDFQKELKEAYKDLGGEKAQTDIICGKCNKNNMIISHGAYGFYLFCAGRDTEGCKYTQSCDVVDGKAIIKDNYSKDIFPNFNCPKCNSKMFKLDGKFGPYLKCADDNKVKCVGNSKVPYGKKCPDCKKELYQTFYENMPVLFCMGYPNCYHRENLKDNLPNPNNYSKINDVPPKTKKILKAASKK